MSFNLMKVIKGLLITQENTLTPKEIEITPGGTVGTKTTIQSNQSVNQTLTLPDATDTLVGKATSDTLTNKTLSGNTASNLINGSGTLNINSNGVVTLPNVTDTLVGKATSDTLTNKSIDAATNTLTNIANSSISATAAIDASKIANGLVSNAEFQYLDGVTSAIQTQLNAKALSSDLTTHTGASSAHGVAGSVVGTSDSQVLTNKTIDATNNTISNIANSNVSASAAIAHSKMAALTASKALTSDASGIVSASSVTSTELGYVSGVTSAIQTQLNNKITSSGTLVASKVVATDSSGNIVTTTVTSTELGQLSGITSAVVGISDTQVLTNKDHDGGTASNTSRITLPKAAKTVLDALTRKVGTILFDTTSNRPYYDDGSTLKLIGSGSGAGNFITNGDAEGGTTGFVTYTNTAQSRPVTGV
ncbi:MAG: hypothetical protein EBZ95_04900 [Chitinophagia bacterium]|nr:hypothetical protein [Chitinophagia bacterium]